MSYSFSLHLQFSDLLLLGEEENAQFSWLHCCQKQKIAKSSLKVRGFVYDFILANLYL